MDPLTIGILALVGMIVLIALGVPIGAAMGMSGLVSYALLDGLPHTLTIFGNVTATMLINREMATIPLFLLLGGFATVSGISEDIFRLAYAFIGHYRGGLAAATVFGCAGFGSVCGSSTATAATMTHVALPEMLKHKYSPGLATGCIAAAGTLGILIPPSIAMVLYAYLTGTFILDLFAASLIPSIITVVLYWIAIAIVVKVNPEAGPAGPKVGWPERWIAIRESWATILLIVVLAGGIYTGAMMVDEAAAAGTILAVVITIVRRRLTWAAFVDVLLDTAANTAMIYMIIIGATIFSYTITVSTIPEALVAFIQSLHVEPIVVILLLMVMYLLTGAVFESFSALVLTIPFVFPLIVGLGFDPVWWGILMVIKIEVGQITPPLGMNVFVVQAMARYIPLRTVFAGVVPFLLSDVVRLGLLIFFPGLTLYLVRMMH
jgi:tripartite ATP-independent transporter DctM subunit